MSLLLRATGSRHLANVACHSIVPGERDEQPSHPGLSSAGGIRTQPREVALEDCLVEKDLG